MRLIFCLVQLTILQISSPKVALIHDQVLISVGVYVKSLILSPTLLITVKYKTDSS